MEKSERQIKADLIAKQLGIPESLMKGIEIPENSDITTFLTSYKKDIDTASSSQGKKPNTVPAEKIGTKEDQEYASCLLKEYAVDGAAYPGETLYQFNQRRQAEDQTK